MPIPPFLAELRSYVGTRPLWLSGVGAVVVDDAGRVLLGRRADSGAWAVIGGILDPGEEPADCVVREVYEEAGVVVVPELLTSVTVSPMTHYPNGDQAQYLDLTFRCRLVSGEARVNDDESLEITWFAPEDFPELDEYTTLRVSHALAGKPEAAFARTGS